MVDKALLFLRDQVNDYLLSITGESEKLVVGNVVNQSGELTASELGLSLLNIQEERVNKSQTPYTGGPRGYSALINPEIKLNLYVLFTANFGANYDEALKFICHVITFLQGKNVFTRENAPDLDPGIEKLIVDLVSPTFEEQNRIWTTLGAKYIPSAVYKIRMLVVQQGNFLELRRQVETVEHNL